MDEKPPNDAPDYVLSVWIGGPLDGLEKSQPRCDAENCLGKEIICGGGANPAAYRFDATIDGGHLVLRFVRLLPK